MSKQKAQTLQQRFGFQDSELSTPKHDEIMLWLDSWLDSGLPALLSQQHAVVKIEQQNALGVYECIPMHIEEFDLRYGVKSLDFASVDVRVKRKVWEFPITDRSYTIGFADMLCLVDGSWGDLYYQEKEKKISLQRYHDAFLFFEVKPTIPSLGEVIRQVRMYETYTKSSAISGSRYSKWFIVSPDTRFKSQIEAQNIGFLEVTY